MLHGKFGRSRDFIMHNNFWKGKAVLITGFEGFLGSNLTKALVTSGAKIIGLDIKVRRKKTILTAGEYNNIIVIKGSVTNYKLVQGIINKYKINIVFHLAAKAIVGESYSHPLKNFSTNIGGTWKVLDACRNSKSIQAIIIASSDKAYGSHKKLPYTENAHLQGSHPYDVSKSCADLIAYSYFYTYGLPVSVTRCGNMYGRGDFNFSRLVPDALRCASVGKTLQIRSNGKFVRDYVFVKDIVNGYIILAEKLQKLKLGGEAFNFSNEKPLTVIELLGKINKLDFCGRRLDYKIMNTAKYEIKKQYLSSAKARRVLNWRPAYELNAGLQITADWYFNYFFKK